MRTSLSLAWSFLREQRLRSAITVFTTAAATAIVLWVVGGYEAMLRSYDKYADVALGRYALVVDPISRDSDRFVPADVVGELRADPRVVTADPMSAERVTLQVDHNRSGASREHLVLGTDAKMPPFDLAAGTWIHPQSADSGGAIRACLAKQTAEWLGVDVGDELPIGREGARGETLRIVGLVDNPKSPIDSYRAGSVQLPTPSTGAVYVDSSSAARIHRSTPDIAFIGLELAEGVDVHAFRYAWAPSLGQRDMPLQFQEDIDLEEQLDETATKSNVALQAYGATVLSMLLAFIVIFNTLSMGVTERTRVFALLRAVALTRGQVFTVILVEGLLLAVLGFLLGLGAGLGLMQLLENALPRALRYGAELGATSLTLAAVSTFGAALLAALLPAWRATRVRPLDAIAPERAGSEIKTPSWTWGLAALLLMALAPIVRMVFPPSFDGPYLAVLILSYLALAVGSLMLCPVLLHGVDRLFAPLLARLLRIDPMLLAEQLASKLWRNVGATLSLSLGLGLLISVQAWGFTMLETFVPGRWTPDATVVLPEATAASQMTAFASMPGVRSGGVLPFVVEQPRLREDLTGSAERASIIRQDNLILVGVDPSIALGGDEPVLPFEWIRGSAAEAAPILRNERGCVVPDHFLRETGLDLGDTFEVVPPESPEDLVSYRIAGSVQLKGWHWQTKMTEMRVRTHRTAALGFANIDDVTADFDLGDPKHVWLRMQDGEAAGEELLAQAKATFGDDTTMTTVYDVTGSVRNQANAYLWAISGMPIVVTAIASLGLLNLLLASIRSRSWEFGVLRALGFTRGTLVRLVIAESLLIAVTAVIFSVVGGMLAGWSGTGVSATISFFGGMEPILVVPWAGILVGSALLLLFATGAASIPARSVVRTPTLKMLQAGRAAF